MKAMKKRISFLVFLAVAVVGAFSVYGGFGGPEPTKSMGRFASFSFYGNGNGNAAVQWMQPGAAPATAWNEFWFDPQGNLNVPGGLSAGGPANTGAALNGSVETPVAQFYCMDAAGRTVLCGEITLQMTGNTARSVNTAMNWYTLVNGVLTKVTSF